MRYPSTRPRSVPRPSYLDSCPAPTLHDRKSTLDHHSHIIIKQLRRPSLLLQPWCIANQVLFVADCILLHIILLLFKRPTLLCSTLLCCSSPPSTPTSSPTSTGPSHELNSLLAGNEEGPTKPWRIRGGLPISRFSKQGEFNHRDRLLPRRQPRGLPLSTMIPTTMTSPAIRCHCPGAIHQGISLARAYKRTVENLPIFLFANAPNPLLNQPGKGPRLPPEQLPNQLTRPQTTPGMPRVREIDEPGDLQLHGRLLR